MNIRFDFEKAIEAILYITKRVKDPTLHNISKVLYFADQIHIVEYGRFITGDRYVAMKHGPVPSATYDILKYVRGDSMFYPIEHAKSLISVNSKYYISVQRDADVDAFSDSDLECLDKSISENGHLSFDALVKKSHDKIYDTADQDDFIPIEAFATLAENPAFLREHIK